MDLIGVAFPTKGYSTLWGGIGYFEYYLKNQSCFHGWEHDCFFFLCRKEISDEISLLELSRQDMLQRKNRS